MWFSSSRPRKLRENLQKLSKDLSDAWGQWLKAEDGLGPIAANRVAAWWLPTGYRSEIGFLNVCRASLLATKPSFWLNEVRGSWLTGVLQPWPWKTAHYFLLSENLESDCRAGVDGKGTNQDSLDMFKLSLNLDRIHALQSSELINQGDWVHSGMKIRTASP